MSGGLLTQDTKRFGEEHGQRWLVSAYEAGDVVLHNSYTVPTLYPPKKRSKGLMECFRSMHQLLTRMKMVLYVLEPTCVLLIVAGHGIRYVHLLLAELVYSS